MATKKKQHKAIQKLSDLTPDDANLNKGTERGRYMLEKSLETNGAGRSILVDRDGKVIAGNKTLEVAGQMGIDEIIVIPSDGKKLVVVQRTDLSMDDPDDKRARVLAYADNRVAQVDLEWDYEKLLRESSDVRLDDYVTKLEIERIKNKLELEEKEQDASPKLLSLTYRVIILCDSENHQKDLLDEFEKRGLKCQALIS